MATLANMVNTEGTYMLSFYYMVLWPIEEEPFPGQLNQDRTKILDTLEAIIFDLIQFNNQSLKLLYANTLECWTTVLNKYNILQPHLYFEATKEIFQQITTIYSVFLYKHININIIEFIPHTHN